MIRLKLFLFYAAMAWVSVISPRQGRMMIDAAEADYAERVRRCAIADIHANGRAPRPDVPGNGILFLAVLLSGGVTVAWLVLLCGFAFGWFK